MGLAEEVRDIGHDLSSATGQNLSEILNRAIGRFLGWPYKIASGAIRDRDGHRSATFASVIYTSSAMAAATGSDPLSADIVAAVIDAYESIDLQTFRDSYRRIAEAKKLKKSAPPQLDYPSSTTTLGMIFALRAVSPMEELAEELDRLNRQTPSEQWPDMVVIASIGVINYAVQFPGEQSLSADFLPPAQRAVTTVAPPPMYIVIVMRPTGTFTFNKMFSYLIAHLQIFSPGASLPDWRQALDEVPKYVVTVSGYQFNLAGTLAPVPRHLYNDRYLAPLPMRVEDQQGTLLCTLRFIPWQDGGVVLLHGRPLLEPFLLYLGLDGEVLQRTQVVTRGDAQISSVLPIAPDNFNKMLMRIGSQTNMVVSPDRTQLVLQKISDEGTQSPFIARLLMGILRLRDLAFLDATAREPFDNHYEFIVSSILSARASAREIVRFWDDHQQKVVSGAIVRLRGNLIEIDQSIDNDLRRETETFVNAASRALKEGMQKLTTALQVNIGFLFQKQSNFERRLVSLQTTDALLAEYLSQTRTRWSERLLERRTAIEHEGWTLPRVKYSEAGGSISVAEPIVSGEPVTEFVKFMFDRLSCFVEEVTVHCLQQRMSSGITVAEIPPSARLAEAPERFRVTFSNGGMPPWRLAFHTSWFNQT